VGYFEAEVPDEYDIIDEFQAQFPGQAFRPITQGDTSSGNPMKYGVQYRIYLNNIDDCPPSLMQNIGRGLSHYVARINKSLFVEKLVDHFGFQFGHGLAQDAVLIREIVQTNYPAYFGDFERGYNL
jgi:hypothetical protein